MVYTTLLCFEPIEVSSVNKGKMESDKGLWLQHNPSTNLLAIMATSHQVYHEARRVFYRLNTFVFRSRKALLMFLIHIGRKNASLLTTVKWQLEDDDDHRHHRRYENHIDIIKPFLTQKQTPKGQPEKQATIWNSEAQYHKIYQVIKGSTSLSPGYWQLWRLIRLDVQPGDNQFQDSAQIDSDETDSDAIVTAGYWSRFVYEIECYDNDNCYRPVKAGYDMQTRFDMETEQGRMDALMFSSDRF